jgi:ubiquitin carboxyl-terminal hydrolase 8
MPLARYFLDGSYRKHINRSNPMGTKGVVAETYSSLIKSMWSETEMIVIPSKFKEIVGKYSPSFQGSEQHDSQEFLAFLLDALHEDLNLARRGNMKPEVVKDEDSDTIPDGVCFLLIAMYFGLKSLTICCDTHCRSFWKKNGFGTEK